MLDILLAKHTIWRVSIHDVVDARDALEDRAVDVCQNDEESDAPDQRKDAQPAIQFSDIVAKPIAR